MANKLYFKTTDGRYIDLNKAVSSEVYKHSDKPGEGAKKRKGLKPEDKVQAVMGEFKRGTLRSGSGEKVTSRDQAIAIAMSESGLSKQMVHDVLIDYEDYMEKANQLKEGIKVEKEHIPTMKYIKDSMGKYHKIADDKDIAKHIAGDHLDEISDYYTRLLEMEKQAKADKKRPQIEIDVIKFLIDNPNPPDSKVHAFAEKKGISPHKIEAVFYKLATERAEMSKDMQKARVTKYIKRVSKPSGKGYYYFYNKSEYDQYKKTGKVPEQSKGSSVWDKLKAFFGGNPEEPVSKLHDTVTTQGISITKDSLAEHLAEYIANKSKWDARFSGEKKEKGESKPKSEQPKSEKKEGEKKESKWNTQVMKFFSNQFGMIGALKQKEKSGAEKFVESAEESQYNLKNLKSQKIVNFKGDDTDYHVVDDWTQDGIRLYRVVIDEKIDQFDNTKDTDKREVLSEVIPASEFEDKKENKPKSVITTKRELDNKLLDEMKKFDNENTIRAISDKYANDIINTKVDIDKVIADAQKISKLDGEKYIKLQHFLEAYSYERSPDEKFTAKDQIERYAQIFGQEAADKRTDKKSPDNFDTMPEGEKKSKSISADQLFDIENKIMDKLDVSSGGEVRGDDKKAKEYAKAVFDQLDKKGVTKLSDKIHDKLEDQNYHLLNLVLSLGGYYGEKSQEDSLNFVNKMKAEGKEYNGFPVSAIPGNKLFPDQKPSATEALKEELGKKKGEGKTDVVNIYSSDAKKLSHGKIDFKNFKDEKEKKIFEQLKPANMITDGGRDYKPLYSYSLEGQDQGVWTDSRMLIIDKKVSDEIYETNKQREFLREKKKNPDKTDEQIIESIKRKGEGSFPNWKQIIPKTESLSDKEAKFTGQYHKPEDKNAPDVVEYSDDNVKVHFMADYIATIKNKFPDAKMYLTGTMSPAVFKVGNEIKAVVMPIQQKAGREMKTLEKALLNLREELMFKAQTTKYIKRIPNPKGKGYIYFYTPEQVKAYQKDGTIPNQQKKPEVKTEPGGKTNIEKLKEVTKKVATILADALSAKDAVQPTGAAVEQTGENIGEKAKEKKRLEEKSVSDKKKPEKKPEDKPKK